MLDRLQKCCGKSARVCTNITIWLMLITGFAVLLISVVGWFTGLGTAPVLQGAVLLLLALIGTSLSLAAVSGILWCLFGALSHARDAFFGDE